MAIEEQPVIALGKKNDVRLVWQAGLSFVLLLLLLLLSQVLCAQVVEDTLPITQDEPTPISVGPLTLAGEIVGRGQGWDWFLGNNHTRYAFADSLLRLSLSQQKTKYAWKVELAQPTLYALPNDALQPGTNFPIGEGGRYFAANQQKTNVAGLFIKQAYFSIRGIDRNGGVLQLGRFAFADGTEKTPIAPDLAWIKRERIAQRLIGDAYWTHIGRSFDGLHFSDDIGSNTNITFVAGRATRGVYQTDGMGEMDVDLLYAAYTRELITPHTASELRVFALGYHDGRGVLKADNRSLAARQADTENIRIGTFGVNYAIVTPLPHIGKWDLVVWGAEQFGHWGNLSHHADSGLVEIGWRPPVRWIHPWLRAGAFYATGDGNPNDRRHTTFFQPLPTEQLYARMPFYTLQNSEDYTGQVIVQPSHKLALRAEVHKVKLHSVNDLWYMGTGAFQNTSFGYDGLPNHGHKGLGNYVDLNTDYQVNSHLSLRYYLGVLSGKGAMTARPQGRKGGFTYFEFAYKF
jgi:hypothetical protein